MYRHSSCQIESNRCVLSLLTSLVLTIVLFGLFPMRTQADDNPQLRDTLTEKRYRICDDYSYNAGMLVTRYYEEGKIDSIHSVLDFWEQVCGNDVRIDCVRLLLAIREGTFTEEMLGESLIDDMLTYRRYQGYVKIRYSVSDMPELLIFIKELASGMVDSTTPGTTEHLLVSYLSGEYEFVWGQLRGGACPDSKLNVMYRADIHALDRKKRAEGVHLACHFGKWLPRSRASLLGEMREIGVSMGYRLNSIQFDLTFLLFGPEADNEYTIVDDSNSYTSDRFLGRYIGIDVGYVLTNLGNYELNVLGGIGYDGINNSGRPGDLDEQGASAHTLNLNFGVNQRFYLSDFGGTYLSLTVRYNIVNYDTHGGTDLSGNTISAYLSLGWIRVPGWIKRRARLLS